MKSQRQRREEALAKLKERIEFWTKASSWPEGKPITELNLSWRDHEWLLGQNASFSKCLPIMAARKIETLTKESDILEKKLKY